MKTVNFNTIVNKKTYRFFDFGCSKGHGITHAYKVFGDTGPGLGLDVDENKIKIANDNGHDAITFDILKVPEQKKLVDFVTMFHFLEHLPSPKIAAQFLRKAARLSRQFICIRQPFFDADGYLAQKELKLYWSDWHGHPNKMTSLDFYLSLLKMKNEDLIKGFGIYFHQNISSSDHADIHPINSPTNQQRYEREIHPMKYPNILLNNVYREIIVLVHIDEFIPSRFTNLNLENKILEVH